MLKMCFFVVVTLFTWMVATDAAATNRRPLKCGWRSALVESRISGGSNTKVDDHPWLVTLKPEKSESWGNQALDEGQGGLCSGVIISEEWILTSAWCVNNYYDGEGKLEWDWTYKISQLSFGDWNYNKTENVITSEIEKVVKHPKAGTLAEPSTQFDFALVKMTTSLDFESTNLMPICWKNGKDFTGQTGLFVGSGVKYIGFLNDMDKFWMNMFTQELEVTVLSKTECSEEYAEDESLVTDGTYCVQNEKTKNNKNKAGPCYWDTGVPLIVQDKELGNYELAGLATYKSGCKIEKGWSDGFYGDIIYQTGKPTIVSRFTPDVVDWIKTIIPKPT